MVNEFEPGSRACTLERHEPSFLMRFLYNAGLTTLWPFLFYYYNLRKSTDGKYQSNYRFRLGLDSPPSLASSRRIWLHALSVGETLSAAPLVRALKEQSPRTELVFSNATETGSDIARKRLDPWVSSFFFMPHDFPWLSRGLVRSIGPAAFVLVETDLWPNLLQEIKRAQIPSIVVNGRFSPRSHKRLLRFRSALSPVLGGLDLVFAQSLEDKLRYEALGAPAKKVFAAGNLKFDALAPRLLESDISSLRVDAGIGRERPVWIAGSTHEGEEEILLEVHRSLRRIKPDLLLILAPRQVNRALSISDLCKAFGFSLSFRSRREPADSADVYLLDTLGELGRFYALADAAFIGGSFVPAGGHNPLEAVAQEKPVFWGPHLSNFREIESHLLAAGCGQKVLSAKELEEALIECLGKSRSKERMSEAAGRFLLSHSGCSREIAARIIELLKRQTPIESIREAL